MRDVARDLRRSAEAIEIPLMGAVQEFRRIGEGLHVEDRERLLERLDRGAEDLLDDRRRRIVGPDLLMKIDVGLALVGPQGPAQFLVAAEAEPLGGLHHHRLGGLGLAGDRLQRKVGVSVAAQQDFCDARLGHRQFRKQHSDPGPDGPRIKLGCHSRPRVSRSISIASMMMTPVASN